MESSREQQAGAVAVAGESGRGGPGGPPAALGQEPGEVGSQGFGGLGRGLGLVVCGLCVAGGQLAATPVVTAGPGDGWVCEIQVEPMGQGAAVASAGQALGGLAAVRVGELSEGVAERLDGLVQPLGAAPASPEPVGCGGTGAGAEESAGGGVVQERVPVWHRLLAFLVSFVVSAVAAFGATWLLHRIWPVEPYPPYPSAIRPIHPIDNDDQRWAP